MNERQKLGRLEKLLGNFQKIFSYKKLKTQQISFSTMNSTTGNTKVYKIQFYPSFQRKREKSDIDIFL